MWERIAAYCSGVNVEGFDFHTDPFGNLYSFGVLQANRPLPAEKFLIYSYRKKFSNYYGDSDLRECYRAWWAKDNLIKFNDDNLGTLRRTDLGVQRDRRTKQRTQSCAGRVHEGYSKQVRPDFAGYDSSQT
jgi:hypothetical protein